MCCLLISFKPIYNKCLFYEFIALQFTVFRFHFVQCLDAATLLRATNTSHNGTIGEETFGTIATTLLYIAINHSAHCHDLSNLTNDDVISSRGQLLDSLSEGQPSTGLKLGIIQEALEMIHFGESHEHTGDENATERDHTADEEHEEEHDDGHEDEGHNTAEGEEEHVHAKVIEDKVRI